MCLPLILSQTHLNAKFQYSNTAHVFDDLLILSFGCFPWSYMQSNCLISSNFDLGLCLYCQVEANSAGVIVVTTSSM
jgi:hypothetical protein